MFTNELPFRTVRSWAALLAAAWLLVIAGAARAQSSPQQLVDESATTLSHFMRDPDMTWLQRHLGNAKAVLIAPSIVKAGYIFGGSGGRAVVFARDGTTGRWVGPAFYNLGAASVGFQAGVEVSESVMLAMTDKALDSLLSSSIKLGGDASIAAGPVGAGAKSDVMADFVAFSRAKGIYGGLNLEGSVVGVSDDWNRDYYGKPVLPPDILVRANVHNAHADRLLAELRRASSKSVRLSSAR
ncbi:MAG: lipid-binding SYLF domain-containing protein [Casimicrobiaceae bacterium]